MRSSCGRGVLFVIVILALSIVPSAARGQNRPEDPACLQMPPTVRIDAMLQPAVTRLLARSETVRRQCAVFWDSGPMRIDVRLVPRLAASSTRARATAHRYEFGFLAIVIEIPLGADYAELLAHEFEHALEQIEHLDLAALARTAPGRAHEVASGEFETARAREAGRAAASEVSGALDPAVAAAGGQIARMARQTWRALGRVEPLRGSRIPQIHRK